MNDFLRPVFAMKKNALTGFSPAAVLNSLLHGNRLKVMGLILLRVACKYCIDSFHRCLFCYLHVQAGKLK